MGLSFISHLIQNIDGKEEWFIGPHKTRSPPRIMELSMEIVKSKIQIRLRNYNVMCPLYNPGFSVTIFVKNLKQRGVETKYTGGKHTSACHRRVLKHLICHKYVTGMPRCWSLLPSGWQEEPGAARALRPITPGHKLTQGTLQIPSLSMCVRHE